MEDSLHPIGTYVATSCSHYAEPTQATVSLDTVKPGTYFLYNKVIFLALNKADPDSYQTLTIPALNMSTYGHCTFEVNPAVCPQVIVMYPVRIVGQSVFYGTIPHSNFDVQGK